VNRTAIAAALLMGVLEACGGGAAPPGDGGGKDMPADTPAGATLTGTFTPSGGAPCLMTPIKGAPDAPQCTVTEHLAADGGAVTDLVLPTCDASNFVGPCWSMSSAIGAGCAYETFFITSDPSSGPGAGISYGYSCLACPPGSPASGC
jgi:hypothetical protein